MQLFSGWQLIFFPTQTMFKLLLKTLLTVTILFISLFVRAVWRLVTCNAGAKKRQDLANKIQDLTGKMLENLDAPNVRASMVVMC